MIAKTFQIKAPNGLNTRHISHLVLTANRYDSVTLLKMENDEADMKSLMNMMALIVRSGDTILIEANGIDEKQALEDLTQEIKKLQLV
jgi:phosphocarrier protein HPr